MHYFPKVICLKSLSGNVDELLVAPITKGQTFTGDQYSGQSFTKFLEGTKTSMCLTSLQGDQVHNMIKDMCFIMASISHLAPLVKEAV
jgi:hypothetical protein